MLYLVQENIFREEHEEKLIHHLNRMDLDYELFKMEPFTHKIDLKTKRKDVFSFGSVKSAQVMSDYSLVPGSMYNSNHDFEVYGKEYGDHMLNSNSIIMNFEDPIPESFPYLFFGRPTGDTKKFDGRVFTKDAWYESVNFSKNQDIKNEKYDNKIIHLNTRVMISPLKKIKWECRCWVVNKKVITTSQYKLGYFVTYENKDHEEWITDKAQEFVDLYQPAEAFVIDICEIDNNGESEIKIVEINCINCAGFYHANLQKLLNSIENHFS